MRSLPPLSLTVIRFTGIYQLLRCLVEVGARDVQGLPLLAKPAPRQNYAPMSPHANGTRYLSHRFISGRIKEGGGMGVKE